MSGAGPRAPKLMLLTKANRTVVINNIDFVTLMSSRRQSKRSLLNGLEEMRQKDSDLHRKDAEQTGSSQESLRPTR